MKHNRSITVSTLLLAVTSIGCSARPPETEGTNSSDCDAQPVAEQVPPANRPTPAAQLLAQQLEDAYRSSSSTKLATFLDVWHASMKPIDIEEVDDPLERDLYSLFRDFYNPSQVSAIAGGSGFSEFLRKYERTNYVIVQNSLRFRLAERDPEEVKEIADFRPHIQLPNRRVLYLTARYREALVTFLDNDGISGSSDRLRFLETLLLVYPGHWEGWDLLTPPTITAVELDRTEAKAKVYSMILSDGAITTLKRTSKGWQMEDTGILFTQ